MEQPPATSFPQVPQGYLGFRLDHHYVIFGFNEWITIENQAKKLKQITEWPWYDNLIRMRSIHDNHYCNECVSKCNRTIFTLYMTTFYMKIKIFYSQ